MDFFKKYSSNTYAASANQHIFSMNKNEIRTGRIFYKITNSGTYNYALLFSNILDSTYALGDTSHKNLICDPWIIHEAKVGKCPKNAIPEEFVSPDIATQINNKVYDLKRLTFDGNIQKQVAPGEFFTSDEIEIGFEKNEYLCLELTYSGKVLPYHEESLLPVYNKTENGWIYSKQMPFPGMIGCDRSINSRIAYIGDSITQGIGSKPNSYSHWNALVSEMLGSSNAFWNLGIGYGRANDAASDGAWLYKARQNDIVFVCYGVNDILRGFSEEQIKSDLTTIVTKLKESGIKVVLQTVPPFDYEGEKLQIWKRINLYIKEVLKDRVDIIFDNVPILGKDEEMPQTAIYGGHPNAEGCALWAEALYVAVKDFIK